MKLAKFKKNSPPSAPAAPLKLDLGCGPGKKPGFTGVDQTAFLGVDVVLDLRKAWPWKDNSVEEAHCSHCLEHFDAMERVHVINELYRVLKVGAKATVICPHWSSCRAYGDPTHKWPPVSEFAFFYWKREWRMANAPHTDITNLNGGFNCNFDVTWGYSLNPEVAQRNQEYQQYAMSYLKEACLDSIATLTKC
jgi:SAM-dependent methyltransferase